MWAGATLVVGLLVAVGAREWVATRSVARAPEPSPEVSEPKPKQRRRWDEYFGKLGLEDLDDPRWRPNELLVETVQELEPGRALDVAMGQGRNALFLAEQGWKVTGFDNSTEALHLVRLQTEAHGVNVEIVEASIGRYDFGVERWDLIVVSYMHTAALERADDIVLGLAPGGVVVVESFLRSEQLAALGRPKLGLLPGQLHEAYLALEILRYEEVVRTADWAPDEDPMPVARLVARKSW